ncbi:MAG: epoxyqueuosine reductase QueH [Treponema sp.]|jgi:tRNA A37 threonylcarbamoyladenosine dehydratase/predicted adenine nucleotide alpha hydrolase (AANH) superfamily ATPase|nr:epoxyqueuosine reductase QueH [Treponema sp.]
MKLLFHCCCAPCAVACVENLAADGIALTLFWHNPNIHPLAEYRSRRDTLIAFAAAKNLPPETIDEYGLKSFLQEIGEETEAPARCEKCYRMRLEKTAAHAAENGFDAFCTSLLISPYQRHEAIRSIGEEMAARYGVGFLYRDFRPLFRQGQGKARNLGLYMQKYCGCIFSSDEREAQRQSVSPNKSSNFTHGDTLNSRSAAQSLKPKFTNTPPHFASLCLCERHIEKKTVNPLFQRLALITGADALEKLEQTKVLVFGLGGVGSWCAEALVRSGVGKIGIVDSDVVCVTNVNRQVQATGNTLGRPKAEALKQRLLEINPYCEITAWEKVFSRENAADFGIATADYVIDAIDSLAHKLDLIETSCAAGVTLFSSMGMAQKLDPTRIKAADIWETEGCPLARLVRQGLRKRDFSGNFTAVYSDERLERFEDIVVNCGVEHCLCGNDVDPQWCGGKKVINGSAVTVTASAGMALASLVLRDIMGQR